MTAEMGQSWKVSDSGGESLEMVRNPAVDYSTFAFNFTMEVAVDYSTFAFNFTMEMARIVDYMDYSIFASDLTGEITIPPLQLLTGPQLNRSADLGQSDKTNFTKRFARIVRVTLADIQIMLC